MEIKMVETYSDHWGNKFVPGEYYTTRLFDSFPDLRVGYVREDGILVDTDGDPINDHYKFCRIPEDLGSFIHYLSSGARSLLRASEFLEGRLIKSEKQNPQ